MRQLHKQGLGTTSKQAEPITPEEEALLWKTHQFGTHSGHACCTQFTITTVKFSGYEVMTSTGIYVVLSTLKG